MRALLVALVLALFAALEVGCAGGGQRDLVGDSHDVAGGPARGADAYVYIARRPLAILALAEARGLSDDDLHRVIDHLADALDACTRDQARRGARASGTARVVAAVDDGGVIGPPLVTVSPGSAAQASALLCLVAPLRISIFSARAPGFVGNRGLALEATWGET